MKKYIIVLVVLIIIVVGIYLVTSNNKPNVNQASIPIVNVPASQPSDTTSGVTINIKNLAFNPQILKIKPGIKVTWVNNDSMAHTVTSDSDNILNSPTLSPGQSFSFTFANTGTTNYHCNIHRTMQGIVVVE